LPHALVPNKKGDGFEFATTAATKLLRSMTVRSKDDYSVDRVTLDRVKEVKTLAEKALGGGEDILANFAKLRSALSEKAGT
jgi:hypothetical protein